MIKWTEQVKSAARTAVEYAGRDVVPLSTALEIAARLEECQQIRYELIAGRTGGVESADLGRQSADLGRQSADLGRHSGRKEAAS